MNNSLAAQLIRAIEIFDKYMHDGQYFTNCSHDKLWICVDEEKVSPEDVAELDSLGFNIDNSNGGFYSYKYGSC